MNRDSTHLIGGALLSIKIVMQLIKDSFLKNKSMSDEAGMCTQQGEFVNQYLLNEERIDNTKINSRTILVQFD